MKLNERYVARIYSDITKPGLIKVARRFCSRSRVMRLISQSEYLSQVLCVGTKTPPRITNELKFAIYSEVVPAVSICSQRDNSRAKSRWPIFYCARTNLRAIVQSPRRICNFQTAKAVVWLSWNFSHVYPVASSFFVRSTKAPTVRTRMYVSRTCSRATMNHS